MIDKNSSLKFMIFLIAAVLVVCLILVAKLFIGKWIGNDRFAREFFQDKVDIVRIVASKRWHDFSDAGLACTYAAVEFSEATADKLRAHGPKALVGKGWSRGGQERWNVHWQPTPTQAPYIDQIDNSTWWCLQFLPKRDFDRISDSLTKPGSWYHRGSEISNVLSPDHRLAVTLRFGD